VQRKYQEATRKYIRKHIFKGGYHGKYNRRLGSKREQGISTPKAPQNYGRGGVPVKVADNQLRPFGNLEQMEQIPQDCKLGLFGVLYGKKA
jgi:glutamate-1-semialdehyde aminotransferase